VLDEEASFFLMDRRDLLLGVPLVAALPCLPWTSQESQSIDAGDDGGEFLMIDGWVFRREDLAG
jgi:hypothetical protein